ncbi:MAG TPA: DUF1080 domain-containing protein, partial [Chryseolinea sp.]|nr:DUF1080 domain-containing protein [Chryseolinea sp.]
MKRIVFLFSLLACSYAGLSQDQSKRKPEETEVYTPVPPIIQPGEKPGDAPSDAIILFNGKNLDEWVSTNDPNASAKWTLGDNLFTVKKGTGNIQTKRSFTDYQLHLEWRIPEVINGTGQGRGNSGLFLAAIGPGDDGYEIQILDCYNNKTYVNGQTGSIYKQHIPLANACKKPGEWQTYDIIWTAPRFNDDGSLKSPASVSAIHNGILLQNNVEVKGKTVYIGDPSYKKHG